MLGLVLERRWVGYRLVQLQSWLVPCLDEEVIHQGMKSMYGLIVEQQTRTG